MIRSAIQFQRLSERDFGKIHSASLQILAKTGVRLHLPEAVELLRAAGADVSDGNLVRIPAELVDKALKSAPHQVPIYNQKGEPALVLGDGESYYGTGSDCLFTIDHHTDERRLAVLQDVVNGARMGEALPNVDFLMSMFLPSDIDPQLSEVAQYEVMFNHTTKPIVFVTNEFQGCIDTVAMAEAVAGSSEALQEKPFLACYINVTTGLVHNEEALQKLLYLAEKGIPALYIPMVTAGMTGPMSMPASMAMINAGSLVGVVLSQLKREGAPVILTGCTLVIMDMQKMVIPYCAPNARGMGHDMAQGYQLPTFGLGGASESKMVDQQAGIEAALTLMTDTLYGGHLIHDMGYLESGLTGSLAQLVICDEIVGWLREFTAPVEINEETLLLDMIHEQGPDGAYVESEHTLQHYREQWYPGVFDRGTFDQWQRQGGKSLGERAAERVDAILAGEEKMTLSDEVSAAVKAVHQEAADRD
jgi:trimethylamine---corrinoid protein Co-methyltransferase